MIGNLTPAVVDWCEAIPYACDLEPQCGECSAGQSCYPAHACSGCPVGHICAGGTALPALCTQAGAWCPPSSSSPVLCEAGCYGTAQGASSYGSGECAGLCSEGGFFCPAGSTSPVSATCAQGRFGTSEGAALYMSSACGGSCMCVPSFYCPPASTTPAGEAVRTRHACSLTLAMAGVSCPTGFTCAGGTADKVAFVCCSSAVVQCGRVTLCADVALRARRVQVPINGTRAPGSIVAFVVWGSVGAVVVLAGAAWWCRRRRAQLRKDQQSGLEPLLREMRAGSSHASRAADAAGMLVEIHVAEATAGAS